MPSIQSFFHTENSLVQDKKSDISRSDSVCNRVAAWVAVFSGVFGVQTANAEIPPPIEAAKVRLINPKLAQERVSQAIANFANDLSSRLIQKRGQNSSFSLSPVSVIAALGMALKVIHPENKEQYLQALGLGGLTEGEVHQAIAATLQAMALPQDFKEGTMEVAQSFAKKSHVWTAESLPQFLQENYRADLIVSNQLMQPVNQWVNTKTHGKIPTILSDDRAELVLLNAIYLDFQWKEKFSRPERGWKVEDFTFADGTTAPVSMMTQTKTFPVYRGEAFDLLEKPYRSPEGRNLSQLIVLPHNPEDLSQVEQGLTGEAICFCRQQALRERVDLSMPKIKMESAFSLLDLLKEMGLPLEDLDRDLFSGVIKIYDVLHKTFVATDEEGTEAAAVTAVLMERCMAMPLEPRAFNINRSYAYFIMDGDTVLFRGRVADKSPLVVDFQR